MRLDSHKSDINTQFGEDGCIAHIFDRIGIKSRVCVEFGAGDGESCSNTARLWRDQGWRAVLVEPDAERYKDLEANSRLFDTICRNAFVTPTGPGAIHKVLEEEGIAEVDFMSIDIDGDDFFILQHLEVRPRVIAIEFNPTIPPHIEMRQRETGGTFGASLLAIVRLGGGMNYRFVGATYCNAFLVDEADAAPFNGYETNPEVLFPPNLFTYAVTDYAGRAVLCGQPLPWTAKEPYVEPLAASTNVMAITDSAQQLRRGFESLWGPAVWLSPNGLSAEKLALILTRDPPLVCIDVTTASPTTIDMFEARGVFAGYRILLVGQILGLIRPQESHA